MIKGCKRIALAIVASTLALGCGKTNNSATPKANDPAASEKAKLRQALAQAGVPLPTGNENVDPKVAQADADAARALEGSRDPFEPAFQAGVTLRPTASMQLLAPTASPEPSTSPSPDPSPSPSPEPSPKPCPEPKEACVEACAEAHAEAYAEAYAQASATTCAFASAWACVFSFSPFAQVCAWAESSACADAFAEAFGFGHAEDHQKSCNKACSK